jgi:hypothetical protein
MRIAALASLVCLVAFSGCGREKRALAAAVPAAASRASPSPADPVSYGPGFFALEKDATGLVCRWMGEEAFVLLRNNRRDSRLRLAAQAPIDHAVLRLELNGEILEEFVVSPGDFEKEYRVPAERQDPSPWSELHILTSAALQAPHDPRRLGLRVFAIDWSPE